MKIDRAGWPFVHGALLPALVLIPVLPWVAAVFGAVALFMVYFFRDPERAIPSQADAVVSPADGRVLVAGGSGPADVCGSESVASAEIFDPAASGD
jgi:phosphatidylserine decarboxylase